MFRATETQLCSAIGRSVFSIRSTKRSGSGLERLDVVDFRADVTVFRLWSEDVDFGLLPYGAEDVRPTRDVHFFGIPRL